MAIIRAANHADCERFMAMAKALYVEDVVGEAMNDDKASRTFQHLLLQPDKGQILLAERDGQVVGYLIAIWFWSNEFGGEIAILDEIYVEPDSRGEGIAAALLGGIFELRHDLSVIDLEVSPENQVAYRWYCGRGFVQQHNRHLRWTKPSSD